MYTQMLPTAIQIRAQLLSTDPTAQDAITQSLGFSQPHVELIAIASALTSDITTDPQRLTISHVKRLLNAAAAHLAMLPTKTQSARIDVTAKCDDLAGAAIRWGISRNAYKPLQDHIASLCFEMQEARKRYDLPQPKRQAA